MAKPKLVAVRVVQAFPPYNAGEIAGFTEERVAFLTSKGLVGPLDGSAPADAATEAAGQDAGSDAGAQPPAGDAEQGTEAPPASPDAEGPLASVATAKAFAAQCEDRAELLRLYEQEVQRQPKPRQGVLDALNARIEELPADAEPAAPADAATEAAGQDAGGDAGAQPPAADAGQGAEAGQ